MERCERRAQWSGTQPGPLVAAPLAPVGAVYDTERDSKYYAHVRLPQMYDGIVFISESTAAKPLN